jgi:hypothetical protein
VHDESYYDYENVGMTDGAGAGEGEGGEGGAEGGGKNGNGQREGGGNVGGMVTHAEATAVHRYVYR